MGSKLTPFKIGFGLWLVLMAGSAQAAVPELEPANYTTRYDVTWNGLPLGRVRITTHEDDFSYRMTVDSKTRGLADMFAESQSIAEVQGAVRDGAYVPQRYSSTSTSAKEPRKTLITYDEDGKIEKRSRTPQDDPAWRPVVPLAEANSATDPMTAFFILRKTMRDNMAANQRTTKVKTYEGARYAEFSFQVISPATMQIMNKSARAINIVPKRQPLNGYTPKELKKFKKGDPTAHLYMSADARFIPLMVEMALPFGTLKAELTELKETD